MNVLCIHPDDDVRAGVLAMLHTLGLDGEGHASPVTGLYALAFNQRVAAVVLGGQAVAGFTCEALMKACRCMAPDVSIVLLASPEQARETSEATPAAEAMTHDGGTCEEEAFIVLREAFTKDCLQEALLQVMRAPFVSPATAMTYAY